MHVQKGRKAECKTRQTWVLRNRGFQLGRQKRPGRARERRRGWLATIMATAQEKEKERRRDGRGGTRVGATRKNWEGRVCQSMSEREEHGGVTRGATGGQRRGRNEYRRSQKGRTSEARARVCVRMHASEKDRK
jgi:hypothetical protein